MARRRITHEDGLAAVDAWRQGRDDRRTLATAVRYLLEELSERVPGGAVEVRVPPFGVTQCIAGADHSRGTPPNVVEFSPATWLELATGRTSWDNAREAGLISASGTRADLSAQLPLQPS
ncbi:hypothetical protein FEF26_00240 [Nesterenkonia salmonea]|uniref:Bacterial SCP orthologue domain-containing protein n=1 Tax=Nesterenkonia salmonea TaxID=1804987 RepID=A0A5R9BMS0_9MICC|nr:sterol carrier family protein [Nesterenkonia salmonea]TLQ01450.1 hypothetical protein FEF26_00240 [Nesterenkonia salmonea]